ncbi:MAG: DUF1759 domain-containing protein, partial [Gammaproteobacteria bacterium]|nr:DUF1759 domain-containing protein [Gammaproteobacteria bacterium]
MWDQRRQIERDRLQMEKEEKAEADRREERRLQAERDERAAERFEALLNRQVPSIHDSGIKSKNALNSLPALKIPTFSGKLTEWQSFWSSFSNMVDNVEGIEDCQKLQYLRTYLDGEAKAQLAGYSNSNANYGKAKNHLLTTFGDKQAILSEYVKVLRNLPLALSNESLSKLYTELNMCYGNLLTLFEDDVNALRVHLAVEVDLVFSKLSFPLQSRLIRENGTKIKSDIGLLHSVLGSEAHVYRSVVRASSTSGSNSADRRPGMRGDWKSEKPATQKSFQPTVLVNSETPTSNYHPSPSEVPSPSVPPSVAIKCTYCDKNHRSTDCNTYPTHTDRFKRLKEKFKFRFCSRCIKGTHVTKECRSQGMCRYCGMNNSHHHSLCFKQFPGENQNPKNVHLVTEPEESQDSECEVSEFEVSSFSNFAFYSTTEAISPKNPSVEGERIDLTRSDTDSVPLQYAVGYIRNPTSLETKKVHLIIDSGSEKTYIRESIARRHNLDWKAKVDLKVCTFANNKVTALVSGVVDFEIQCIDGKFVRLTGHTITQISKKCQLKAIPLSQTDRNLVQTLCKREEVSEKPRAVELEVLIGNDYCWYFQIPSEPVSLELSGCKLLNTKLGWVTSGYIKDYSNSKHSLSLFSRNVEIEESTPLELESLWKLESMGIKNPSQESDDIRAQTLFDKDVTLKEGRVWVSWPFKEPKRLPPDNYSLAYRRLEKFLEKLQRNPEIAVKYTQYFRDQEEKGVIERVTKDKSDGPVHYIPHSAVITPERKTTKLRIVYDASARQNKQALSLNDCLYRGPIYLANLVGLLLRFRMH